MARRFRKLRRRRLGGKPRRRVFKRRFRRRQRMSYGIQRTLINADTQYVKMRFAANIVRLPGGPSDQYIMSGNSIYDPDVSGGALKPGGFEEWMALYTHYQVLASSITVMFTNLTALPFDFCIRPTMSSVNIGIEAAIEQPYAKVGVCSAVTARGVTRIKSFMRSKKLFGRTLDSLNYTGTVATNPAVPWYWYINNYASDGSSSLNYSLRMHVTYYVKLWQRTQPLE